MFKKQIKRSLALLLVTLMIVSCFPLNIFASAEDDHTHESNSSNVIGMDSPLWDTLLEMNAVCIRYLGTETMSEEEVIDVVINMDWDTMMAAMEDIEALEKLFAELSEDDQEALSETYTAKTLGYLESAIELAMTPSFWAASGTAGSVLEGAISFGNSNMTSFSISNDEVTTTIKGGTLSKNTGTVTLYNDSGKSIELTFDYDGSSADSISINSTSSNKKGTYTKIMVPNESIVFSITSKAFKQTSTLKLKNFNIKELEASINLTVSYNDSFGSVMMNGADVPSGDVFKADMNTVLSAIPNANSSFVAWLDADTNELISKDPVFYNTFMVDKNIKAVFCNLEAEPYFWVSSAEKKSESIGLLGLSKRNYYVASGCDCLVEGLDSAISVAKNLGRNTIVLASDATLHAGNYNIPSGITLLIPFDDAGTLYTTEAQSITNDFKGDFPVPTTYRKLTLADGVNITVDGAISLSAKHYEAAGSRVGGGSPAQSVSMIEMQGNSKITVNNKGALYAYGFITGTGSVEALSGSSVYEYFQIMDFRGGSQTTGMENSVFPLSQYYVQNIEVALKINAGATEYSYTSIAMSGSVFGTSVGFIGSGTDAMFKLSSGYVIKRYDGATDRLDIEAHGNIAVSPIKMSVGTSSIDSKNYSLPINGNMTVNAISGNITISQNISFLPGSEIIIGKNATCTLGSGCEVIVYDADDWGGYCAPANKTFIAIAYAPGKTYTRTDADLVDATVRVEGVVDASSAYLYTTAGGANVYGVEDATIKVGGLGKKTVTHQIIQAKEVADSEYPAISITPAKIKNADGTYATVEKEKTYTYTNGVWDIYCTEHTYGEGEVTTSNTCTTDGVMTYECTNCHEKKTEVIPAAHTVVKDAAIAPTCTSTGLTEGSHCSACGVVLVAQEVVPESGHTAGADATCTEDQKCTGCGIVLQGALGHKYTSEVVAPTCTEEGYTKYTCSECNHSYTADKIPANGHIAGAEATCTTPQVCTECGVELTAPLDHKYVGTVTKPTCTSEGYTIYTCSDCGDSYKADETAAIPHSYSKVVTDPTCTEGGYTTYTCVDCGYSFVSDKVSPKGHITASASCTEAGVCVDCGTVLEEALGHNYNATVTAPTCTTEGYTTHVCTRCNDTYKDNTVAALGHTEVVDKAVAPKCEETGLTEGKHCSVCEEVTLAQEVVPALGHTAVADKAVDPTCTETGLTEGSHCSVCNEVLVAQEVVPALGHTAVADKAVDPTCTETGLTEGSHCSVCEKVLVAQEVVKANGHRSEAGATCTADEVCADCGAIMTEKLGHKYVSTVVAPTCTDKGYTAHVCSRCSDSYKDSYTDATGHNMAAATCELPSMCVNPGCNYSEGSALGHTRVFDEEMPAFCTQDGLTEGVHCSTCNKVLVAQEVIPALGHDLVSVDAKKPTYTAVGWNAYDDCTRCSYSTKVEIAKIPTPTIKNYDTFIENLALLEEIALMYANEVPGVDPLNLVIKYIRTGVERYNSGSWGIMAGFEDANFAAYVARIEDEFNSMDEVEEMIAVSSLKKLANFKLPNGETADIGHVFGTMDITYHNNFGVNHADVAGWAGDLVDLLEFADISGVNGTLEEMVADISANYLGKTPTQEGVSAFNELDLRGDLDAYYIMKTLETMDYSEENSLVKLFTSYFTENLDDVQRAEYFIENRLDGETLRSTLRDSVYNAYTGNKVVSTLESTREFKSENLNELKKACCYAFADYICALAGDFVAITGNAYVTPFSSEHSVLAPGITQTIKQATSADGKQMVYYLATADVTRNDVQIYANYKDNDPSKWGMQTVLAQANAAQNKYGNPESEHYIENYNVIASINGAGFNMATGEPGGLLVMNGQEYHAINNNGFFGMLKDGTPVIATTEEYNTIYKDQVQEGIAGFGDRLIKDGEIVVTQTTNYYSSRASRTAIGITKTGKVVFMVLDGRQEPISCGGSMIEIAQIMLDAGCVQAVNLDGGGSSTFVSKPEGQEELVVVNRPSDGVQRSVSTSLIMVSTAPSSTAFDHATIDAEYNYMTVGSTNKLIASGVSATGNTADLPDGTYWAVSDERWATVTEDGVLTALRTGAVDVYLMLGDAIIATKEINVVVPSTIYFTRADMNAVYGQSVELPIVALYNNKPVAINAADVTFEVSNESAGTVDGFFFTGTVGSKVKNVVVSATLVQNQDISASILLALYNQGETTFDFDQATGGDRTLAWYREVQNATTENSMLYEVIDPSQPMTTTYAFAIDMTQITLPEQLSDLVYMLPGADLENASAWNFMLQLAERVSVLTEVSPTITFDSKLDVDYSEIKIVCEYFKLAATNFDSETNTLTLTLKWIDQTKSIDPATANPICIVSGVKLTPKADVDWGSQGRINIVAKGEIGYKAYLRASALYSFAQKPENQEIYGLMPFVNPDLPSERGAYFGSVYAQFEDTYTLVNSTKNGWINEDGGFAYYVDGTKVTGVNKIDGFYYDFGDNGINVGQNKYTGLFLDKETGLYRFAKFGELTSGWQMIGNDWYLFSSSTMAAVTGTYQFNDEISYELDETGKVVEGFWAKTLYGMRYYYGPSYYYKGWQVIDGKDYFFENTYRLENSYQLITENQQFNWYYFDENGVCDKTVVIPDGFYTDRNGYGYCQDGKGFQGLKKIDGVLYCFDYRGYAMKGNTAGYFFGDDYKAYTGFMEKNGDIYYYENGRTGSCKLTEYNGEFYYIYWGGLVKTGKLYVSENDCGLIAGDYYFDESGKLMNGVYEVDGKLYYFVNGKTAAPGLYYCDGAYYCVYWGGEIKTGKQYVSTSYCDLSKGEYEFGVDGKMLNGIVEKDGVLYYYSNGRTGNCGLVKVDGAYYYSYWGGVIKTGKQYVSTSYCDLPKGEYEFGTDGKMLNGIVEKDGVLYYYNNGRTGNCGLVEVDGAYYYSYWGGVIKTGKHYVSTSYCDLPKGEYEFGTDGKMLNGVIEKDGVRYLYINGRLANCGLYELNGDYYYSYWGGVIKTGKCYVSATFCDLPAEKEYTFGEDGKMLRGVVVIDGIRYYYDNGSLGKNGLYKFDDGNYYNVYWGGIIKSGKLYVSNSYCDLPAGKEYEFDENGMMLNGLITKEDGIYYYNNGRSPAPGLIYLDGYYYYVYWNGKLITDRTFYVSVTNGYTIRMNYTFDELGRVILK